MATINSTPRAGLPQWGANDQVKFMTDMSTAFSDIDKKFALTGDAVIPCTAAYDTATKRHTLTPTQTGITLPDIFTARFLATTAFTAGDKVYIGGAEYVPSYTDGDTAVETGAWIVGAVVSLDCKKAGLKAYVGAGFDKQLSQLSQLSLQLSQLMHSGAGAHNAIYRGVSLGTSVTAAQYAAISAGTFENLYIGDYWTIGGVNYRIAAFDYYWNCGDIATPPHHAVIVPDTCLYSAVMNPTDITTGGYVGSQMYTTNLTQAKTTIKAAFSGHVVNHRIYLTNAVSNGYASAGAWCYSEIDLMNEQMVYGGGVFSPVSTGSTVPANYRVEKNQLPLFAMNPAMLNTRENYWLRDVITASAFAFVYGHGGANYSSASGSLGVRPAFCIS